MPELTNDDLLELLAKDQGLDVEDMLEENALDAVVPGICRSCQCITDVEPDAEDIPCPECEKNALVSSLVLAEVI